MIGQPADTVRCRAQLPDGPFDCKHGKTHDPDSDPWRDDGTYDYPTDSVVCDPCYVQLIMAGVDRADQITGGIARLRKHHGLPETVGFDTTGPATGGRS